MSNKEPSFTVRAQIRCLFTLGTCMVLTPGMQSVVELLLLLLLLWQVACVHMEKSASTAHRRHLC